MTLATDETCNNILTIYPIQSVHKLHDSRSSDEKYIVASQQDTGFLSIKSKDMHGVLKRSS